MKLIFAFISLFAPIVGVLISSWLLPLIFQFTPSSDFAGRELRSPAEVMLNLLVFFICCTIPAFVINYVVMGEESWYRKIEENHL